jgi:hypothetical protein
VQKKEQEKGTLFHGPSGYLAKKLALLRQFLSQFSPTASMLSVKEWVLKEKQTFF